MAGIFGPSAPPLESDASVSIDASAAAALAVAVVGASSPPVVPDGACGRGEEAGGALEAGGAPLPAPPPPPPLLPSAVGTPIAAAPSDAARVALSTIPPTVRVALSTIPPTAPCACSPMPDMSDATESTISPGSGNSDAVCGRKSATMMAAATTPAPMIISPMPLSAAAGI